MDSKTKRILDYIVEEVSRQGHSHDHMGDGTIRVLWMLDAWIHAYSTIAREGLTLSHIEELGKRVEPLVNATGIRTYQVAVGARPCLHSSFIKHMLLDWIGSVNKMSPLEAYREFEIIHPFGDGNGRTGKILLNFLNDSLDKPIFPPNDFWGRVCRNP